MSKITIQELEQLFKLVMCKLKKDTFQEIVLHSSDYWIILSDEWNNMNEKPTLSVGSLDEDIAYLKQTIKNNESFTYSDMDRLSSVLRAISEQQAPSK